MFKPTIRIQVLLSTSLFTFIGSVHAQESASSFEQSLSKKNDIVKQTQVENKLDRLPGNYDLKQFAQELKTRGWDTQHEDDGSLIITPSKSSDSFSDKKSSKNDQWQQLQQKFQQAGWSATIDTDGSMRLTPPNTVSKMKTEEISHTIKNNEDNSFKEIQKKLEESGWDISYNSDGSMLLYPPKKAVAKKLHLCPGMKPIIDIPLPVNDWQQAHDIANAWLRKESIPHSTVGKIRKIFNVYIISIVSDEAPHVLMHQIAIRNTTGAVIVLN